MFHGIFVERPGEGEQLRNWFVLRHREVDSGATIEATMKRHEVSSSIKKRVHYILTGHTIIANRAEASFKGRVISGWPQGGVLAKLLSNLVIYEHYKEWKDRRAG